mgnify:CR=1 FL=1
MDIQKTKKNRVIDLRKKKVQIAPIKILVQEAEEPVKPVIALFQGGTFPCVGCGDVSAQEFGRCKVCDTKHRQLAASLDKRVVTIPEKIPQNLTYRKLVQDGVVVTISTAEPLRM